VVGKLETLQVYVRWYAARLVLGSAVAKKWAAPSKLHLFQRASMGGEGAVQAGTMNRAPTNARH
jgi:hypothetical protein